MSANLELIKPIYAAWERGDFSSNEWADPEIELVFADGTMTGKWTGRSQMAVAWREILNAWGRLPDDRRGVPRAGRWGASSSVP